MRILVNLAYRGNINGNRGMRREQRRWRDEVGELMMGRELSEGRRMNDKSGVGWFSVNYASTS